MQQQLLSELSQEFSKVLEHFKKELAGIRTGRAHSSLVEDILVESYGSKMPLKQLASISIPESRSITISPWDKSVLKEAQKAIEMVLGVSAQNDGSVIRVNLPLMTEERRKDLIKVVGKKLEEARVAMRGARHGIIDKLEESGIGDEEVEAAKKKVQDEVDKFNKQSDEIAKNKEEEIMKV
ncbi:MAG: ribosome recycling factor [bacterium]